MTPLIPPGTHLNGTGKQDLVQKRLDVMQAATELLKVMREAMPEDRDYVQEGEASGARARAAWVERLEMIEELRAEIEMEAMQIAIGD